MNELLLEHMNTLLRPEPTVKVQFNWTKIPISEDRGLGEAEIDTPA
jgi:hypothetical protein